MRINTLLILLVAILLTIVFTQNTDKVNFVFLWTSFNISKLILMIGVGVFAFISGVIVGRPKRIKKVIGDTFDNNFEKRNHGTLSDHDKDYIN